LVIAPAPQLEHVVAPCRANSFALACDQAIRPADFNVADEIADDFYMIEI
jgi:hypothetical protein